SDCMTLLLCFFVLLLSFSSFDEQSLSRLEGVMDVRHFRDMTEIRERVPESEVTRPKTVLDQTRDGSDRIMDVDPKVIHHPKRRDQVFDSDVYKASKTLYIPSDRLFRKGTAHWKREGRDILRQIAELIVLVPSHVSIAESTLDREGQATDLGLMRSMAVMKYLVVKSGLDSEQFGVMGSDPGLINRFAGRRVIQISLRNKGLLR
ncbi:MAG: flagellar motor protein MotB, partial [Phycisphaerae bacterium]